jgi:hypothetical protein
MSCCGILKDLVGGSCFVDIDEFKGREEQRIDRVLSEI